MYLDVADVKDAARVGKALTPWREKLFTIQLSQIEARTRASNKRKKVLLENMPLQARSLRKLFLLFRWRHVIGSNFSTFERDVYELVSHGKLSCIRGLDSRSATPMITLPHLTEPGMVSASLVPAVPKRGRHPKNCTCPRH